MVKEWSNQEWQKILKPLKTMLNEQDVLRGGDAAKEKC